MESKLSELAAVKREAVKLQSQGLKSSIGNKIDQFASRLQAVRNAKTEQNKKQAILHLRQELKRYQTLRLRENHKTKSPLQPNGWNVMPTPGPENITPGETKNNNNTSQIPQELKSSRPGSIRSLIANTFESIADFIIPSAMAGEYQQPAILPGVIGCYENQADYDAHISQDMDLLQPEIEVDSGLDAAAYAKITTLAEQLDYSPIKIVEYVTNSLEHEQYLGSVKGALGALTSGGANDIDHASLLIALLRASGIPARYVRGQIYFQDKPAHLNWWNVKDLAAASKAVGQSGASYTNSNYTIDGLTAFSMEHVWVEACVPYGNYRGDGQGTESHRWVPLDPSFKEYDRIDGISQSEVFDYDAFLSKRTKQLPYEKYEAQVLEYIRTINPNLTLADVGTHWQQRTLSLGFLPDTLPYAIRTYTNWSDVITTPRSAILPEEWRASVKIKFAGDVEFGIPMTNFAQHRITLSFEGATSTDNTQYLEFMDGIRVLDCDTGNLTVTPVFKKDGVALTGSAPELPTLSSLSLCDGSDFRKITMGMKVRVNNKTVSITRGSGNNVEFDTISPLDYYALSAYPFNGSDQFLAERNRHLLTSLNSTSKPSDNADDTIGEFLNLVLVKYMRYTTDANTEIGQLFGTTGRSGHHIGLASTRADVEYIFDLPYAMHSNNFVVDVPGGISKAVAIEGGALDFDAMRLTGYTASHYESYVWQENAVKDAVSTVSGLQIASSEGNEVQSFTSGAALSAFVNT
ncbi:MAG TPA: transglutaminase domain-containing protein, partial [Desulfobulbaceae bacterium]|nr:transglutaminase domain-containing protein [Desulfobulbaceae bacterium]